MWSPIACGKSLVNFGPQGLEIWGFEGFLYTRISVWCHTVAVWCHTLGKGLKLLYLHQITGPWAQKLRNLVLNISDITYLLHNRIHWDVSQISLFMVLERV